MAYRACNRVCEHIQHIERRQNKRAVAALGWVNALICYAFKPNKHNPVVIYKFPFKIGYDVIWGDESSSVTCTHSLAHADIKGTLEVTSVSWNSTGSVVLAGYGKHDIEGFCTEKGFMYVVPAAPCTPPPDP